MIGTMLLTVPMLAILAYGALEIRRAPIVGLALVVLSLVAVALIWIPGLASTVAERLQLSNSDDVIMVAWVALVTVVLLNLHLRLRRQMQAVTVLTRQIALSSRPASQDLAGPTTVPR
ncbi:MAG: DUF2304 family protein [Chloroflexota bacterium]